MPLGVQSDVSTSNCAHFAPDLSAYFDNEVRGKKFLEIKAHVETCPVCQNKLEQFRKLSDGLRSLWPIMGEGDSILEQLRAKLASEDENLNPK